ncbi:MAG: site-specific integrase [Deltaproteobacteria bacterium]|jgi:integrase|nr:site-specific integrase [Deltaproteobacteria bacterium]
MAERTGTIYHGVYYRELKARFRGRPDRTYEFYIQEDGRKKWYVAGRASKGWGAKRASEMRAGYITGAEDKPAEALTVRGAADIYLAARKAKGQQTRVPETQFRNYIYPHLGEKRKLRDIRPQDLRAMHDALAARLAGNTVRGALGVLGAAVSLAKETGRYTGTNPVSKEAGFRITVRPDQCERFLTRPQAADLLAELAVAAPLWHDMALVSLHTGARLTELMTMRVQDLQPDGLSAVISGKTGGRDALLLTPEAGAVLARRAAGKGPGELLFGRHQNQPFRKAVARLGLNAGLGPERRHRVWFHTLRHTFASWLVEAGTDIYTVQKLMRHKNIAMTQRYAHVGRDGCRAGLDRLLGLMAGKD